jgi:hypothetical protein
MFRESSFKEVESSPVPMDTNSSTPNKSYLETPFPFMIHITQTYYDKNDLEKYHSVYNMANYRTSLRLLGIDPNTSISDIATRFNIRPVQYSRPYRNGRMTAPISFPLRVGTSSYNTFVETKIQDMAHNTIIVQTLFFECEINKGGEWEPYQTDTIVKGKLRELDIKARNTAEIIEKNLRQSNVELRNVSWRLIGEPEQWVSPKGKNKMKMKMGYRKDVPMKPITDYMPRILKIEGDKNEDWNNNTGECVQDYLTDFYKDQKGMKKLVKDDDWLYKIIDENKIIELKEEGVCIDELILFCDKAKVSMIAYDANDNCITYYKPKVILKDRKSLMFRCMNAHIYPIENEAERKSIRERATYKNTTIHSNDINPIKYAIKEKKSDKKSKKVKEEDKDWELIFMPHRETNYNMDEVNEFMLNKLYEIGMPHPSGKNRYNFDEGKLTEIRYSQSKIKIIGNPKDLLAEEYCYRNRIKYEGQNTTDLCMVEFNKFFEIDRFDKNPYISNFNPIVLENLIEAKGGRTHIGLLDPSFLEDKYDENNILREMIQDGRAIAYDIEKCYSSLLKNPLDGWMVMDYKNEVEDFDGELKTGFYFVSTEDITLFKKSSWYSNKIIQMAIDNDIKFKIKKQILPSKILPNKFHELIDIIYKKSGEDADTTKLIVNKITGMLGKSQSSINKVQITTDHKEMYELLDINEHNDIIMKELEFENERLWIYGSITEHKWLSNCLPMYIQILDWSNMKLFEMSKQIGGTPIYRKVDMVVCLDGHIINEPKYKNINTWGSYRLMDKNKVKISLTSMENAFPMSMITDKNWNDWDEFNSSNQATDILEQAILNDGCLIIGGAGTGKTKILLEGDKDSPVLAPTNASARNANGQTYHMALGMSEDGKISEGNIKKFKGKPYIRVDEIGMVSFDGLVKLMLLKQSLGITIICFGDLDNQLTPVEHDREFMEEFSYKNHSILKYICGYNKVVLTENFRQKDEPEFIGLLDEVRLNNYTPILPLINLSPIELSEHKLIVFFNKTRDRINDMIMNAIKPSNALWIEYKRNFDDKQKSLWLFNGLKLMAIKNNMELKLINSDEFIVKEYNNETFTIEDEWGEIKTLPLTDIHKYFVVNYASTIYKNQGLTIKAPRKVIIYDWLFQSQYKRVKYTILTRVQKLEQLYIGEKEEREYLTCGQRPKSEYDNDFDYDDFDDHSFGDEDLYALQN